MFLYSIEIQKNIVVFIMVNICYVLLIGKAHGITTLPVLCKFMAYEVFHSGGLFIKPSFETLQFSFGLPKLLSISMLRKKLGRFHLRHILHRKKGKSFSSEQKYFSLRVLFQGLINVT